MIWGKERGDLGTRGLVNRQRIALPLELGGLKVLIIPSVMIKAIRTDMVTPFFYVEKLREVSVGVQMDYGRSNQL